MQRETQRTPKGKCKFKYDPASADLASLSSAFVLTFQSGQIVVPLLGRICNTSFQTVPKLLHLVSLFIMRIIADYNSTVAETILPFIALQD